jgi:hypothetical protein
MAGTRAPLHLGGPLGAIGLGCVGGAVALAIAALNNEPPDATAAPAIASPVLTVETQSPASSSDRPVVAAGASRPALGDMPPPENDVTVVEIAQVQTAPLSPVERAASADGTEVHFIVRLKGAPEIDVITRNFKRDPAAAQTAWQDLVTRLPGLADFALVGASYSGEIKLAYRLPPGASARPEDIRAVQDTLLKVEGVSYADPDYVAHPGKDPTP